MAVEYRKELEESNQKKLRHEQGGDDAYQRNFDLSLPPALVQTIPLIVVIVIWAWWYTQSNIKHRSGYHKRIL